MTATLRETLVCHVIAKLRVSFANINIVFLTVQIIWTDSARFFSKDLYFLSPWSHGNLSHNSYHSYRQIQLLSFPVFLWRHSRELLEEAGEVLRILEAEVVGNLRNAL